MLSSTSRHFVVLDICILGHVVGGLLWQVRAAVCLRLVTVTSLTTLNTSALRMPSVPRGVQRVGRRLLDEAGGLTEGRRRQRSLHAD
jgi:hypothetical protein